MAEQLEVVSYYTRAHRFPKLIGQLTGGWQIPFGPYTITQLIGGVVVVLVGWRSLPLWAGESSLTGYALVLVAAVLTVFALGRMPLGGRGPLAVLRGLSRLYLAPRHGSAGDGGVQLPRPVTIHHCTGIPATRRRGTPPIAQPGPDLSNSQQPAPTPQKIRVLPAPSGVQALLATTARRPR